MTKDRIIPIVSSIFVILVISFATLIPSNYWKLLFSIIFYLTCVGISYLVKKRSILSINKRQVLVLMGFSAFLYILLLMVLGISFGFFRSIDVISKRTIISSIIPGLIIIISIEIIRRVFLSQETKFMTAMSFIMGVLSELLIYSNLVKFTTFTVFMELVGMILLPSIPANILYTHVGKKYGYLPNILFRIILFMYPYISPVVAGTPDILESVIKLILPLILYIFISYLYTNKNSQKVVKRRPITYVGFGIFLVLIISIAMLISCQFKYGMIVVGSGSMSGEIEIGDALIYRRYEGEIVNIGDVIVFEKDKTRIIHRVVEIETINGITKYYTKGDALDDIDDGFITSDDIVGFAEARIMYIGYPTLWIREIFL